MRSQPRDRAVASWWVIGTPLGPAASTWWSQSCEECQSFSPWGIRVKISNNHTCLQRAPTRAPSTRRCKRWLGSRLKNIIWGEEIRTFTYLLKGKETEKVENRLMRLLSCRAQWEEDGKARGNKGHFSEIPSCSDLASGTIWMFLVSKINKNKIKPSRMGKTLRWNILRNKQVRKNALCLLTF